MFTASPTHELGVKYLHQFSDSKERDLDVELKREELTNTLLSLRNSSLWQCEFCFHSFGHNPVSYRGITVCPHWMIDSSRMQCNAKVHSLCILCLSWGCQGQGGDWGCAADSVRPPNNVRFFINPNNHLSVCMRMGPLCKRKYIIICAPITSLKTLKQQFN